MIRIGTIESGDEMKIMRTRTTRNADGKLLFHKVPVRVIIREWNPPNPSDNRLRTVYVPTEDTTAKVLESELLSL